MPTSLAQLVGEVKHAPVPHGGIDLHSEHRQLTERMAHQPQGLQIAEAVGQVAGDRLQGGHAVGEALAAKVQEVEVLRHHLGAGAGEVHADRGHLAAEVVDVEAQLLGQQVVVAPEHPAHPGQHAAVLVAAAVDREHAWQAEIPDQIRGIERRHEAARGGVHMNGDVEAGAFLQGIELPAQLFDRLVAAIEGAAQDAHHPDRVLIAAGHRLLGAELETIRRDRHQARLYIEVGAELVPADLGVGAHHQVGAAALQARRPASLAPVPLHHQAAEHAALAGAGGGGANGLGGIGGIPEIGQDPQTALLQFGGLGIFVLIDDVLIGAFLHQPPCLRLHPGAHKGGQIQASVAIEHQVVVDQLVGVLGIEAAGGE